MHPTEYMKAKLSEEKEKHQSGFATMNTQLSERKDQNMFLECNKSSNGNNKSLSVSPLKDSFLKNITRSRKEVIYGCNLKRGIRSKRTSENPKTLDKPFLAEKSYLRNKGTVPNSTSMS